VLVFLERLMTRVLLILSDKIFSTPTLYGINIRSSQSTILELINRMKNLLFQQNEKMEIVLYVSNLVVFINK